MQTQHRFFDDLARVAGGALGAVSSMREELGILARARLERALSDMDLVSREDFDAVKAMAAEARLQNEALARRIEALEAKLAGARARKAPASRKPAAKKRDPA